MVMGPPLEGICRALESQLMKDGNFAGSVRTGLLFVGLLIMFVAYKYVPPAPFGGFLLLLGLGIAAVGGVCKQSAHAED